MEIEEKQSHVDGMGLLTEITEKQLHKLQSDDMDLVVVLDLHKEALQEYTAYNPNVWCRLLQIMEAEKNKRGLSILMKYLNTSWKNIKDLISHILSKLWASTSIWRRDGQNLNPTTTTNKSTPNSTKRECPLFIYIYLYTYIHTCHKHAISELKY